MEITTASNSFSINGNQYAKGALTVVYSKTGISIGNVFAKYDELTVDGVMYANEQELKPILNEKVFKKGGGAPSEGVQSLTGDLVTGTSENPIINLPEWVKEPLEGEETQVYGFDADGNGKAITIGIKQLTDIGGFPSFSNGVFVATGINQADQTALLMFIEFSTNSSKQGTFPIYSTGGTLFVGDATNNQHAVNKKQLDLRVPTPPATGNYILKSVDGVVSWVTE